MQRYCPKCFERFEQDLTRCPNDGEKLVLVAEQDLVGTLLDDRYQILSKLGEGGMGTVYIAEQAMIGRKVALKVLRGAAVQDESSVKRFLTEAKAIASLRSPHTVTLHDFGVTTAGLLYYTMELLEGAPLSTVIKEQAPMDWARSCEILLQACRSLEEAHGKGILHRDIKPDNLFITPGPEGEHVTVLDFGIAKLADGTVGTITKTGMICGTPAYLSPEQAQGYEARMGSDLYSLGVVFYEMLAGEPPFSDTTAMRVLMKHVGEEAKPVSVKNPAVLVPESIDQFLRHVLRKNPAERHQDVPEFRRCLQDAMKAAAMEGTVSLPALGTSAAGLREITSDFSGMDAPTEAASVDPMAYTMETPSGALDAVRFSTQETHISEALPPVVPVPAPPPAPPRPDWEDDFPGTDTAALVGETRHRGGLWLAAILLLGIGGAFGVWRPWASAPGEVPASGAPDVAVAGTADVMMVGAPDVVVAGAPDVVVAGAPDVVVAGAPDVEAPAAPDIVVATAPDVAVADVPPPPGPDEAETAAAAAAAAAAQATAAVEAAATAMEEDQLAAEKQRADEERQRRLARERRAAAKTAAAKKAAEVAAAKKAADAAAAKKAADAAAAKKAADAAAAKKAADAAAAKKAADAAATPGLGFRKVTVEEAPADGAGDGIGFRKVEVEEK